MMTTWRSGTERRRAIYRRGRAAEQQAVEYLRARGLELVVRNYRAPCGEIDIIMQDGSTLVFVEVRYRSSEAFCRTTETITAAKRRRLRATARTLPAAPCDISKRRLPFRYHYANRTAG
ncbi:MAG: YraN family protein [Gammaproteobacteria bacterium]|nr:YraN family protein [Gammaproteobacteria bacterium]